MKTVIAITLSVLLLACAAQDAKDKPVAQDEEQAVRDFIELRDLKELDRVRTSRSDSWRKISDRFIIYDTRRESYLLEFARACYELEDYTRIVADVRRDANTIRAGFDTIRGCRISKVYSVTEAEVAELKQLGESPGSRN